jgi:hypothetical protein
MPSLHPSAFILHPLPRRSGFRLELMPDTPNQHGDRDAGDERPPLGGSWAALYAAVLLNLALLVLLFYLFTRAFR